MLDALLERDSRGNNINYRYISIIFPCVKTTNCSIFLIIIKRDMKKAVEHLSSHILFILEVGCGKLWFKPKWKLLKPKCKSESPSEAEDYDHSI